MAKFKFEIPKPKADRYLNQPKMVRLTIVQGWTGDVKHEWIVGADVWEVEVEVPDDIEPNEASVMDGDWWFAQVEFHSSTSKRREVRDIKVTHLTTKRGAQVEEILPIPNAPDMEHDCSDPSCTHVHS
jgi:hypothetical protein